MERIVKALGELKWRNKIRAVFASFVLTAIALPAQTVKTLHSFDGLDGSIPMTGLVQATNGDFYGTTPSGGTNCVPNGCGTIFKITSSGSLTTIYEFCSQANCTDGAYPYGQLIQASSGDLYGTTYGGGALGLTDGVGTIFKITPHGALTTLYSFEGSDPGGTPYASLVQATNGNFYGTTSYGGAYGSPVGGGTIFKINTTGALTTLYNFCAEVSPQDVCTDGSWPYSLIQATNGNFYGTTRYGGAHCGAPGCGTVFTITTTGKLTTLHNFDMTDGQYPNGGLIQGTNGNFYGTTQGKGANGFGTVFEITPSGALTTLYSFCSLSGCTDGETPYAGLVQGTDGSFYGTTLEGGITNTHLEESFGTIFAITPSGILTTLYSFCAKCIGGYYPYAGLIQATNGDFFGVTTAGGTYGNYGEVFSLSVGLVPFVETQTAAGKVGATVNILGNDLTGATSVTFNGTAAAFSVGAASVITATIPPGATTGMIQVVTPSGTLSSNVSFQVLP